MDKTERGPLILSAEPLVSIITLSYNLENYIAETLSSVLSQTYSRIEYIVIDDASPDGSVDVIKKFLHDPRVKFIQLQKNVGACAAYACAYQHVTGELICSIDADDVVVRSKTEKQVNFFKMNEHFDICATYIRVINRNSLPVSQPNLAEDWANQARDLSDLSNWLYQNYVAKSSIMMSRRSHDDVGVPDSSMTSSPDYEHFMRFVVKGYRFGLIQEPLMLYRIHGDNITHKYPHLTFYENVFAVWKNIFPQLMRQRRFEDIADRLKIITDDPQYAGLAFADRMRLLSMLTSRPDGVGSFRQFMEMKKETSPDVGFFLESVIEYSAAQRNQVYFVEQLKALESANDWWKIRSEEQLRLIEQWRRRALVAEAQIDLAVSSLKSQSEAF